MNRTFELSAHANSSGYGVTLKINGRPFACRGRYTKSTMDVYMQIANAVERVYGVNLYENTDNADIVDALVCVEDIIRGFHGITSHQGGHNK